MQIIVSTTEEDRGETDRRQWRPQEPGLWAALEALAECNRRLPAIRLVREHYGVNLMMAKAVVDAYILGKGI